MGDLFTRNTYVRPFGWFGPSYPDAEVTPEVAAAVAEARGQSQPDGRGKATSAPETDQQEPAGTDAQGAGSDAPGAAMPPRSGSGASKDAWAEYARANQVDVPEGAGRADIIAALDQAGVPTGAEQ